MGRVLQISQRGLDELHARAERAYPEECCAVLLGHRGPAARVVTQAVPCANTDASPHTRYAIDPHELIRLQRNARECGLEILGFYHSHPEHAAQPSSSDLEEAYWTGCSYVITAVERGRATDTNSFLLYGNGGQKRFEKEQLIIRESSHQPVVR